MKKRYKVRIKARFETEQTNDNFVCHATRIMRNMLPRPRQIGYGFDCHHLTIQFETPEIENITYWCGLVASRILDFLGQGVTIPEKGISYSVIRPIVKCPICDGTFKLDETGKESIISCGNCGEIAKRASSSEVFYSKKIMEFARKQGISPLYIREKWLKDLL